MTEDGSQRTEVRSQRTEVRGQRTEVRGQKTESRGYGFWKYLIWDCGMDKQGQGA